MCAGRLASGLAAAGISLPAGKQVCVFLQAAGRLRLQPVLLNFRQGVLAATFVRLQTPPAQAAAPVVLRRLDEHS
jgi:hypothetical protein